MYGNMRVSVVMPAYNEAEGITDTVREFIAHPWVDEVVVADNNSTDETAQRATAAGAKVVKEPRQGYGYACRTALANGMGDLIVLTESDNSFYADDLKILFAYIDHFDMVKGARSNRHLIEDGADWDFPLMLGNWLVAKYMQILNFGLNSLEDINQREVGGTYRVIRREALQRILPHLSEGKSAFLPDMTTIAFRRGLKVIEVPIRYRRRLGTSKITGSRIKAASLAFRMCMIISRNRFKRVPK
jgi:glycosyltransferase involved in cell wall biosynthesis